MGPKRKILFEDDRVSWARKFIHHYKLAVMSSAAIGRVPGNLDAMAERAANEAWERLSSAARGPRNIGIQDPVLSGRNAGSEDAKGMHPPLDCQTLSF